MPPLTDDSLEEHKGGMLEWYLHLQPPWRDTSSWPLARVEVGDDWSALRRGSHNGVYLVVLGLSFWVSSVEDPKTDDELCQLLVDFHWVLMRMNESLGSLKAREGKRKKTAARGKAVTKGRK